MEILEKTASRTVRCASIRTKLATTKMAPVFVSQALLDHFVNKPAQSISGVSIARTNVHAPTSAANVIMSLASVSAIRAGKAKSAPRFALMVSMVWLASSSANAKTVESAVQPMEPASVLQVCLTYLVPLAYLISLTFCIGYMGSICSETCKCALAAVQFGE